MRCRPPFDVLGHRLCWRKVRLQRRTAACADRPVTFSRLQVSIVITGITISFGALHQMIDNLAERQGSVFRPAPTAKRPSGNAACPKAEITLAIGDASCHVGRLIKRPTPQAIIKGLVLKE